MIMLNKKNESATTLAHSHLDRITTHHLFNLFVIYIIIKRRL